MIGGIFCDCLCGDDYRIYQVLLGEKTMDALRSITYKSDLILNGTFSVVDVRNVVPPAGKLLLKYSYNALSRRASASHRRGFKNETTDLMKSFGVAIYHNNELLYSKKFGGGRNESPVPKRPKHWPDSSEAYFSEFIRELPNSLPKNMNGWHIVYVATMPYAVRLEHSRVDESGGYGKKVLIGQINTIIKELNRSITKATKEGNLPLVREMNYGYFFRGRKSETASGPEYVRNERYK